MAFNLKFMRGDSHEENHTCEYYQVNIRPPGCLAVRELGDAPGVFFQLMPGKRELNLPEHGDVCYVTNDTKGKTVQTYRWPLRSPQDSAAETEGGAS